jgi:hypothetical protein
MCNCSKKRPELLYILICRYWSSVLWRHVVLQVVPTCQRYVNHHESPSTKLHVVMTQKIALHIFTAVRTSSLRYIMNYVYFSGLCAEWLCSSHLHYPKDRHLIITEVSNLRYTTSKWPSHWVCWKSATLLETLSSHRRIDSMLQHVRFFLFCKQDLHAINGLSNYPIFITKLVRYTYILAKIELELFKLIDFLCLSIGMCYMSLCAEVLFTS